MGEICCLEGDPATVEGELELVEFVELVFSPFFPSDSFLALVKKLVIIQNPSRLMSCTDLTDFFK